MEDKYREIVVIILRKRVFLALILIEPDRKNKYSLELVTVMSNKIRSSYIIQVRACLQAGRVTLVLGLP